MSRSRGAECVVFGRGNTLLREKHGFLRREKRPCGRNAPAGHFLKKVPRPLKNFMGISLARAYALLPCKEAGCFRRGDRWSPGCTPTQQCLRKSPPVGATIGRPRSPAVLPFVIYLTRATNGRPYQSPPRHSSSTRAKRWREHCHAVARPYRHCFTVSL